MSSNTTHLGLLKKNPETDGNNTFNIQTMLNDNWDKIDEATGNHLNELFKHVTVVATLPASPANGERVVYDETTKKLYLWNETEWIDLTASKWADVAGKPASFTPSAHKSTHATGGADAITPGDIGAETPTEAQEKADLAEANAKSYAITREVMERLDQNGVEIHRSGKDANGKFTAIEVKRPDGTLFMKSVLSGVVDAESNYPTRTETFYDESGVTEIASIVYSRTFDTDGDLITEVI